MGGAEDEENLDKLASELNNDEYPKPEGREEYPLPEKKEVSYENVDVTIKFRKEIKKDSETDEKKRTLFTDTGFGLSGSLFDEDRNILRVPIVLAKEMVYRYDNYDAFRPREELKAVAAYLKGVPVTRGHPAEKIVTDRSEVLGCAVDAEFEDDELRVVLEISDKDLIADIKSGELKGVSPGHFSRLDRSASGEYEGAHYDVTQRDIYIDHIAIVAEGRCSTEDGCGIGLNTECGVDSTKKKQKEDETGRMVSKDILGKLNMALKLAEKLEDKALKEKLEELKKALMEEEEEQAKKKEGDAKEEVKTKELDEAMKKVTEERDGLRVELDAIVKEEKKKLIDEMKSLQDVKSEDTLKEMSLDSLKSDLELVKAIRDNKITFGDKDEGGDSTIKTAYQGVGRKGGEK
jgi:hypothetical protein